MRERILALDASVREIVRSAPTERDRAVGLRADDDEADVIVLDEGLEQARVPRVDLR